MARNNINSVLLKRPKRNKFDLSRVNKLTCEAGEIVPFFLEECLPDDSFKLATANRIRLAPQVLPLMHQVDVSMYWFFVPCRILWPNWEEFITGGKDGTSEPIIPYFNFSQGSSSQMKTAGVGMLSDYLGVPTNAVSATFGSIVANSFNFLPFSAYVKIYNDYFRDENFTSELPFELKDGYQVLNTNNSDTQISTAIQAIYGGTTTAPVARSWQRVYGGCFLASWKKEYFTSALPNTQRGPVVNIPLGDSAPVVYNDGTKNISLRMVDQTSSGLFTSVEGNLNDNNFDFRNSDVTGIGQKKIYADLSDATNTNIIELRRAFRIQEFLERMNAGGSRLTEMIYSMFGVKSPDARLQRAEFIGASHNPVLVDAIYQTSASQEGSPLADFAGKAISVGGQKPISYYCKEHGYIMGLMVIRPRPEYQNITRRHWLHGLTGKFDYFWPILANIGDQEIQNRELYAGNGVSTKAFGYTPRYQEYRFAPSETHGEMQTTLKYFHMNRIFNSTPVLNQQFMNCTPRTDMFAVTDGEVSHHYWCEILIGCQAKRPVPKFGTPML
jgi:hypothetical protein